MWEYWHTSDLRIPFPTFNLGSEMYSSFLPNSLRWQLSGILTNRAVMIANLTFVYKNVVILLTHSSAAPVVLVHSVFSKWSSLLTPSCSFLSLPQLWVPPTACHRASSEVSSCRLSHSRPLRILLWVACQCLALSSSSQSVLNLYIFLGTTSIRLQPKVMVWSLPHPPPSKWAQTTPPFSPPPDLAVTQFVSNHWTLIPPMSLCSM